MDFAITVLFSSLGAGVLIVSCAYAHRLFSETKMKRRALERSLEDNKAQEPDALMQRLEEFRRARFSPGPQHPGLAGLRGGPSVGAEKIKKSQ
jgi:hypothetical protein